MSRHVFVQTLLSSGYAALVGVLVSVSYSTHSVIQAIGISPLAVSVAFSVVFVVVAIRMAIKPFDLEALASITVIATVAGGALLWAVGYDNYSVLFIVCGFALLIASLLFTKVPNPYDKHNIAGLVVVVLTMLIFAYNPMVMIPSKVLLTAAIAVLSALTMAGVVQPQLTKRG